MAETYEPENLAEYYDNLPEYDIHVRMCGWDRDVPHKECDVSPNGVWATEDVDRIRQSKTIRLHSMFQMLALQAVILTRMKVG